MDLHSLGKCAPTELKKSVDTTNPGLCALGYAGVLPLQGSSTTSSKSMSVRRTCFGEYVCLFQ